jgi:hypothetical protein
MPIRLLLAADESLPQDKLEGCAELCASFATFVGEPVLFASLGEDVLDELRAWLVSKTEGAGLDGIEPKPISAAPMSAAEMVYREDGRPDWSAMWASFCELALYGGPPHRGAANPVSAPDPDGDTMVLNDAIMEIRRGIWETTGLYSEPAPPSWLAVTCHDRRMAAWMAAAIILENVDAKCEEEILYVPASPDFELKNQIKSVITVVAKVNHYWQAHVAEQEAREQAAS